MSHGVELSADVVGVIVLVLFVLARLLGRRRTSKGRLRKLVTVPFSWVKGLVTK